MDWRHRAACRDEDPELFYPVGDGGVAQLQAAEAKAVCRRCPARVECLDWALMTRDDHGILGGKSASERRELRRRDNRSRTPAPRNRPRSGEYDELTVEHLLAGRRVAGATDADLGEAVAQLRSRELLYEEIGNRLGISAHRAERLASRHRASARRREVA